MYIYKIFFYIRAPYTYIGVYETIALFVQYIVKLFKMAQYYLNIYKKLMQLLTVRPLSWIKHISNINNFFKIIL